MCRRFKVEDGTELESQTLKGEKGRKKERWRECDSNVSVCLIFSPLLKAVLIFQASNTDSKTIRYEDTAQIFYRRPPPPPIPIRFLQLNSIELQLLITDNDSP